MRTFVVTGGAGFIGSHIVDALVARGDKVRVVDNLSTGQLRNLKQVEDQIDFQETDLGDPAALAEAMDGADCVFHQAALASVPRSIEAPLDTHDACVTGTLNVLEAARRTKVRRVVYAASSSAYGDQPASSKRETDMPAPLSPYAAAKLAGEEYCHAYARSMDLETVCLRYFNVFGPRQDPDSPYSAVIPLFASSMIAGRRPVIYGDGHQSRDFTYVANAVQGNLLAADAPNVSGEVFNMANGRSTTLLELIDQLNALLGTNVQPEHQPPRVGDVRDSLADITKARTMLKYEPPVGVEEGLRLAVDYYRAAAESK